MPVLLLGQVPVTEPFEDDPEWPREVTFVGSANTAKRLAELKKTVEDSDRMAELLRADAVIGIDDDLDDPD